MLHALFLYNLHRALPDESKRSSRSVAVPERLCETRKERTDMAPIISSCPVPSPGTYSLICSIGGECRVSWRLNEESRRVMFVYFRGSSWYRADCQVPSQLTISRRILGSRGWWTEDRSERGRSGRRRSRKRSESPSPRNTEQPREGRNALARESTVQ